MRIYFMRITLLVNTDESEVILFEKQSIFLIMKELLLDQGIFGILGTIRKESVFFIATSL